MKIGEKKAMDEFIATIEKWIDFFEERIFILEKKAKTCDNMHDNKTEKINKIRDDSLDCMGRMDALEKRVYKMEHRV